MENVKQIIISVTTALVFYFTGKYIISFLQIDEYTRGYILGSLQMAGYHLAWVIILIYRHSKKINEIKKEVDKMQDTVSETLGSLRRTYRL